jgi:hypothetical protein
MFLKNTELQLMYIVMGSVVLNTPAQERATVRTRPSLRIGSPSHTPHHNGPYFPKSSPSLRLNDGTQHQINFKLSFIVTFIYLSI